MPERRQSAPVKTMGQSSLCPRNHAAQTNKCRLSSLSLNCNYVFCQTLLFCPRQCMKELAWRSGSVMDCHAMARGSIPGGNGVFTELHALRKRQ